MLSGDPPLPSAAMTTPLNAGSGLGRVAVEGDRALELGVLQIVQRRDRAELRGVVADRHHAGVVVDPLAVRILVLGRDLVEVGHLVRREVAACWTARPMGRGRTRPAPAGALVGVGGLDLLRRGRVRLLRGDLDVVLGRERLDDLAVVGPVRRQRDDVERALLLRGGDQTVHAAEVGRRRRGLRICASAATAGRAAGATCRAADRARGSATRRTAGSAARCTALRAAGRRSWRHWWPRWSFRRRSCSTSCRRRRPWPPRRFRLPLQCEYVLCAPILLFGPLVRSLPQSVGSGHRSGILDGSAG